MVSVQPAVRRETRNVAFITFVGVLIMFAVFSVLNIFLPDSVPFNYTVILAGICAGIVATLNFFLMGLAVQKVASATEEKEAKKIMQKSYYSRFGLQILWVAAAIIAPCFNIVAGLIPLMFPGFGIRMRGVLAHIFPKLAPKIGIGDDPKPAAEADNKEPVGTEDNGSEEDS
ncbi:MAG: ATP synthase subunit I [Lachnospiraceae bacterium]|nr:ATP synthase subunit I [Lachnospiraceae bacterium]